MKQLLSYIDGWRSHDVAAVLATLADDCTVIECYGPVYHGPQRVEQWMNAWFGEGGSVVDWHVTRFIETYDAQIAEWTFTCIWRGKRTTFDGATVAKIAEGKITYLRKYTTTAPLYDWDGVWR